MSGRDEQRRTAVGRSHEPDLARFYAQAIAPITPGEFDLQLTLLRTGAAQLGLDDVVESFTWSEDPDSSTMTGSLQLRRPVIDDASSLPIGVGHMVRARVLWAGRWYELWTMRCGAPEVAPDTGTVTVDLEDDMVLLHQSRRDYVFRRSRATRPYYAHEIAAEVLRRNGARVGSLAKGTAPIRKLIRRNASAAAVITAAYAREHEHTGRRFVLRMRDGRVEVITFRRNTTLYVLGDQVQDPTVGQALPTDPVTVLTGKAKLGKGRKAKTIRHTITDAKIRARLGYVRRTRDFGRVTSRAELVDKTKRSFAKSVRITRIGTVTVPLLPFVRRGDGVRIDMPGEGLTGAKAYVYIVSARHEVGAGGQTSTFEWTAEDPYVAEREAREAAQRAKARAKRKKA